MSIFTRTIKIGLHPDEVHFADEHRSITVRPVVFLAPADPNQILSIGSALEGVQAVEHHLFSEAGSASERDLLLAGFLRLGIRQFFGFSFRATTMDFGVSPEIVHRLGGSYQCILSRVGREAGAFALSFSVPPST